MANLKFTDDGVLPAGDYKMTLGQLRKSLLVVGPGISAPSWDSQWRGHLVNSLEVLVNQLWSVGIEDIFIDGSFAEDKDHPNDIDGYFVCDFKQFISGKIQQDLNLLDPYKVWTWDPKSRKSAPGYDKKQLPMWHQYGVELYPHWGQASGIKDKYGNELEFPSAFRQSRRDGTPKGIVQLLKGSDS
jgi:hypothetical protein